MVVIVADAILEASRRPGGLNAPDESGGDQNAKGVVGRLERDGADFGTRDLRHAVGGDVGLPRDRPKDSQPLGCDLDAVLTKKVSWVGGHQVRLAEVLESFKSWSSTNRLADG